MSEAGFIGEARILVRPDTTKFRAELEAALAVATAKPITVPVVPVVATGLSAATAQTEAFTAAQAGAAAETQAVAAALEKETIAATQATAAQSAHSASVAGVARGAGASALTLFGLRGATLAASGAFLAGTAAVVAFSKSLQSAASLETELNVFKVTAGATADEMERVSEASKQLGRDITLPGVTAGEAATAMTELAKAGLSVEDSLAGARGALQLATAAQIDVKDSTNLVAGALNAFQLSGTDAVKVADLLTGAAKESQGEITDMGTALGQVASVSQQFGVSINDTVTLLTELAQAGLSGGRAGTSLRVAFLRLVNPTTDAAKELDNLNVAVRDANGNLRPGVFTDIADALQSYTKAQRDAALATIFGSDAIRAAAIIGNKGTLAFLRTSAAISEVGLAQQQAAARTSGLQGDIENLSNQVNSLGLTLGEVAKGPTSLLVKALGDLVGNMTKTADGAVAAAGGIKSIGKAADEAVPGLGLFGSSVGKIVKITTQLNPTLLFFRAGAFASEKFGNEAKDATAKTDKYGNSIDSVGASLSDLSKNLLQSAADSKVFTQQVTADTAALLQSAADSRIGINAERFTNPAAKQFPVEKIQNIVQGFDAQQVRDKIAGDNTKLLADLQAEQDFLIGQLQRQGVKNRPALKRALEQALLGTVNDIQSVQAQATSKAAKIKSDADKAARDAEQALRAREQALLTQFGVARDQQQNRVASAAQTAGLQDDINTEKGLKALVLKQIAAVKERISVEGGRAAAVAALQAILIQVNGQLKSLAEQQQAAALEQRKALVDSASLDIDLAQITGNRNAEIAARERLIVQLKKEQALTKRGTNEWKQLRNDIAAQNAAIAAVTAEKKKQGQSFAAATFEFLQTQQGFASNLLGNLIPSGATGGLVGGGAVQGALQPQANAAEGRSQNSPTSGQANATNHILQLILQQLKQLNGSTSAPEAGRQLAWQRSTMDYHSG